MKVDVIKGPHSVALVYSETELITDANAALDLMAQMRYDHDAERIALNKEAIAPRFFVLSSGLAGEVLQRFINYHVRLAIYGDFSGYTSKPLRDFIYESNNGRDIFFVNTAEEAVDRLLGAQ